MSRYDNMIGKRPVGLHASATNPLAVFELTDEYAVSAFYRGEGVYEDFRKTNVLGDDSPYIERFGIRYPLSEIVRTGTPWLKDAPICESIR